MTKRLFIGTPVIFRYQHKFHSSTVCFLHKCVTTCEISMYTFHFQAPSRLVQDLNYDISSPLAFGNSEPFLDKYYLKCFTQPSKPFCILSADKRLDLFKEEQSGSTNIEVIENRMENVSFFIQKIPKNGDASI